MYFCIFILLFAYPILLRVCYSIGASHTDWELLDTSSAALCTTSFLTLSPLTCIANVALDPTMRYPRPKHATLRTGLFWFLGIHPITIIHEAAIRCVGDYGYGSHYITCRKDWQEQLSISKLPQGRIQPPLRTVYTSLRLSPTSFIA